MEETQFQSLVQDDTPGEGNSNPFHYSCLGNPMDREPGGLLSMGLQRVGHDLVTGQQHQQSTLSANFFSNQRFDLWSSDANSETGILLPTDNPCGVLQRVQKCDLSLFPESSPAASRDLWCPDEVKQLLLHMGLNWYPLYHQNLGTILYINPRSSLLFSPTVFNWLRIPRYKAQRKYCYPIYVEFKGGLFLFMSISVLSLLLSIQ